MDLRHVLLLLISVFMTVPNGGQGAAVEPAGEVATAPVLTWNYLSGDGTTGTAAIMVPAQIDDAGTLTLVLRANAATTLVRLDRIHVPDQLHFIFGDADSLYVHVPRRFGWAPDKVETMHVEIPYDKVSIPARTRTLKLTDAAGRPLQGFRLGVNFFDVFIRHSLKPMIMFPIEKDGNVKLPLPISTVQSMQRQHKTPYHPTTPPPIDYYLQLVDGVTSQTYEVPVRRTEHTEPVTVMVPVGGDDVPQDVDVVEGEVVGPDGARESAVSISFGSSFNVMPGADQDPTTITVKALRPDANGAFRIAVSDEFRGRYESADGLDLRVREDIDGLFASSSHFLKWGSGARVVLPKRLSLVGSLVGQDGQPIVLSSRLKEGEYPNFSLARIDEQGKQTHQDSMSANVKETTGALFNLKNLPVPGRYVVTAFEQKFGPTEVGETSPTTPLEFRAATEDGKLKGVVQDEAGNALPGALAMLLNERPRYGDYDDVTSLVERLRAADKQQGLEILNGVTSKTLDYEITDEDGAYSFSRKTGREGNSYPYVYAAAPDRFGAYQQETTSEHEVMASMDVVLPDVQLPAKARATGVVHAPELVPDNDHPGKLKPLAEDNLKYRMFVWSSREWFGYGRRGMVDDWEYVTNTEEFLFGEPFEYDVPAGTSYTLAARPADYQLYLNMHLWKEGPVEAGETAELEPVTLRALQPFHLKVTYADGSPATGLRIGALYNTENLRINGELREPVTDENGEYLLYGDEGLAPQINVTRYQPMYTNEMFKIQPLDMSTSVPTLTLQLDPKIWGREGQGRQ